MRPHDPNPDRELSSALRRLDPPAADAEQMSALARRIVTRAIPLLDARRRTSSWWEYMAAWAGTLLPLGLATALVAAACIVWISANAPRTRTPSGDRLALLRAMTNRTESQELVDIVLSQAGAAASPQRRGTR